MFLDRCSDNNRTALIGWVVGIVQRDQVAFQYWKIPKGLKWIKNKCIISKITHPTMQHSGHLTRRGKFKWRLCAAHKRDWDWEQDVKQISRLKNRRILQRAFGCFGSVYSWNIFKTKIGAQGAIQHFRFDIHLFYISIKEYMMSPPIHSWYVGFKTHWITLLILMEASSNCLPQK